MKKCCVIILALVLATGALVLCSIDWLELELHHEA